MAQSETATDDFPAIPEAPEDQRSEEPIDPRQVLAGFCRDTPRNDPRYTRYDSDERNFLDAVAAALIGAGRGIETAFSLAARALGHRRRLQGEGLKLRRIVEADFAREREKA